MSLPTRRVLLTVAIVAILVVGLELLDAVGVSKPWRPMAAGAVVGAVIGPFVFVMLRRRRQ